MLTDIFALRYEEVKIWHSFGVKERRLVVQSFSIIKDHIAPYYDFEGKESGYGKGFWTDIHHRLSVELGLKSLSQTHYSYQSTYAGKTSTVSGAYPIVTVCENWAHLEPFDSERADSHIKERLSLVEIAFRKKEDELKKANAELPQKIADAKRRPNTGLRIPGNLEDGLLACNRQSNETFRGHVEELNTRFRQANTLLQYHNGFIQISEDALTAEEIEIPFWQLLSEADWANVDADMKQALDLRDSGGRDPAFYAARALESAIKIISEKRGATTGGEKSAYNFIENLASKRGGNFISDWESESLKNFFDKIRNPFGHGPGRAEMPSLSVEQTNWAIETCMSWTKSLIRRL